MSTNTLPKAVEVEKHNDGQIWVISLNRPSKRNAINGDVQVGLFDAFRAFEIDEKAKVAILYGKGGHFCAGADLEAVSSDGSALLPTPMVKLDDFEAKTAEIKPYLHSMGFIGLSRLLTTKPTIAAISGYCVAGGLELALCDINPFSFFFFFFFLKKKRCDIRIADETAKFGVFCRRFGVPLIDGGTTRLPKLIGLSQAMDMIITGKEVSATEALRLGLVTRLSDNQSLLKDSLKLGAMICQLPFKCLQLDRMNTYMSFGNELLPSIQNESNRAIQSDVFQSMSENAKKFTQGVGKHGSFQPFQNATEKKQGFSKL
ncbi:enoyl-CoA hydratase/isomerase family protein [Reticulomyxa filosa]|uniref:Enoyl-CoA hydratase/isomerase family protein n=1 Tax=Reticulomyxa filosa TaxID=46433 RepID=X6M5W1_RETFI|nr:enoyl-CoA hydratase/isomerase family protein [Reticulomyxa filosa]|eukprot:ETO09314.1 enoyl-CoA hydratase/isomerase family protein [Reticulomyxa filosa]